MALFRAVMLSVHEWAVWSVWTGTESGYCRAVAWEWGCLHGLHARYDVDHLCTNGARRIKGYHDDVVVGMTNRNDNTGLQRCAWVRGTSLGVLSTGRNPIMVIGPFGYSARKRCP